MRYKNGCFFHDILVKEVRELSKVINEKLKTGIFDGPLNINQDFSKNYFSISKNNLAEIMNAS